MSLLSASEAQRVTDAIARLEARSAGEVVVACVRRSSSYGATRALAAAFWVTALSLALVEGLPQLPVEYCIAAQVPLGIAFYFVFGLPPLLRPMLSQERRAHKAQATAQQVFASRGIHRTRDRTGLLILISELEHQVIVLTDVGLEALLQQNKFAAWVERIVSGIKQRRLGAALVEVIDECATVLAQSHPRRPDDENELADEVVRSP